MDNNNNYSFITNLINNGPSASTSIVVKYITYINANPDTGSVTFNAISRELKWGYRNICI